MVGVFYALAFAMITFFLPPVTALAQQQMAPKGVDASAAQEKHTLSRAALDRMAATIEANRLRKQEVSTQSTVPVFQDNADAFALRTKMLERSRIQGTLLDVLYQSTYFDTQAGTQFSFPEDTHDFCHAYFTTNDANEDFLLDVSLQQSATLTIELTWDEGSATTDYDVYLFDAEGKTVGDPTGEFPDGSNGTAFQSGTQALVEVAAVNYTGPGTALFIAVDRFRGPGDNALNLSIMGDDDTFDVIEYTNDNSFSYVNAAADVVLGALTNGIVLNQDSLGAPRPNLALQFNTNECPESIGFELQDATGSTVLTSQDNTPPYAPFGDVEGDFDPQDLEDGQYTITATPYSQDDLQGASVDPLSVTFELISVPDDTARVISFTLINTESEAAITVGNNTTIDNGEVFDLTDVAFTAALDPANPLGELDIQANVIDANGITQSVEFSGSVVLASDGSTSSIGRVDSNGEPYLLLRDLTDETTQNAFPIGQYTLTAVPTGDADQGLYIGNTIQFTVLGPRIGSYTLINADNNVGVDPPVDGFDPITEGATINTSTVGIALYNIRANPIDFTAPITPAIDKVDFLLVLDDSGIIRNEGQFENFRPYSVFGDCTTANAVDCSVDADDSFYEGQSLGTGSYTLNSAPAGVNDVMFPGVELTFSVTNAAQQQLSATAAGASLANYPNPFNPLTRIRFEIPDAAPVRLVVYDMLGRVMQTLVDGSLDAGQHEVTFDATGLSSGMYLYRLETPAATQVRFMTVLK